MGADDRIEGYASAILEVARAEGELERVGDELFRIARALETSPQLREALTDRRLPLERKTAVLEELLEAQASPLAVSFVNFVVSAGRSADLPAIADRLAARAAAERNRVIAEVRSVDELDEATVKRLEDALGRATGRQVEVKTVIDPTVLGGIVARVGDTVIDGTVRHRLAELRDVLTQ